MQDENKLFDLIKSLTKAEKRYVNLYLSKYELKFKTLFEEINELEFNDEDTIKRKYVYEVLKEGGELERDIDSSQVLKSYAPDKRVLYTRILSAVRAYKANNSIDHKLIRYEQDVAILINKGLYSHARSIIKKAKRIARQEDKHLHLLRILQYEREYIRITLDKTAVKQLKKIRAEELEILEALQIDFSYRDLADSTFLRAREEYELRDRERQKWVDEVLSHPLIRSDENANTLKRKILYFQTLASVAHLCQNYKDARDYNGKIVQEFYKRPDIIDTQMARYLKALNNYITSCYRIKDYDEALRVISSFANYKERNLEEQAQIFSNIIYQKLYYFLNTDQISQAAHFIEELTEGYHKYERLIPLNRKLALFANIASLRFLYEQFETAAMWAEKMLDERMKNVRIDLKNYAYLILLICYCELGDERLATKYFRSFSAKINKEKSKYNIEDKVIGSIYKLRKNGPYQNKDKSQILKTLKKQLDNYSGAQFAGLSELKLWVDSKIAGQSMVERNKFLVL